MGTVARQRSLQGFDEREVAARIGTRGSGGLVSRVASLVVRRGFRVLDLEISDIYRTVCSFFPFNFVGHEQYMMQNFTLACILLD